MKRLLTYGLVLLLLLSGCNASRKSNDSINNGGNDRNENYTLAEGDINKPQAMPLGESERKLIKQVNLSLETTNLDECVALITSEITLRNGYIQSSKIDGKIDDDARRYGRITARIPSNDLDKFTSSVEIFASVRSKSENVDDVTSEYIDVDARIKALEIQETTLLELLKKAEKMEDVLAIQSSLSNTRYDIERYKVQKKNYDTLISYSTVELSIKEVKKVSPQGSASFLDDIRDTFLDSTENFINVIRNIAVFLIGNIIYILFYALVLVVAFKTFKKIFLKSRNSRHAK